MGLTQIPSEWPSMTQAKPPPPVLGRTQAVTSGLWRPVMGEGRQEPREGTRSPGWPPGAETWNPLPAQLGRGGDPDSIACPARSLPSSQKTLGTQSASRKRLPLYLVSRNFHRKRCGGMGWGGRQEGCSGQGTLVHPWLIHVNVWQKALQYCKVISLQFN